MKLFLLLQKNLVLGVAAAAAMQVLMGRQQDLGLNTDDATVSKRAAETARIAVTFANALYTELVQKGD